MYHQVGEFDNVKRLRANYCHVKDFKRHMAFLALFRYKVIPMSQVLAFLKGEYLPDEQHVVAITFDDGYENLHQYALPILAQHGFSAMVYLVSSQLSGKANWLTEANIAPATLLSTAQVQDMMKQGIEFGAHSVTHPRLSTLNAAKALSELSDSKKQLEDTFSLPFDHFCYPYGDHSEETVTLAREAGYQVATTIVKGAATSSHDPLALPRKAISFGRGCYRLWRDLHFKDGDLSNSIVHQPITPDL